MAILISATSGLLSAATTWKKVTLGGMLDTVAIGPAAAPGSETGWTKVLTTNRDSTPFNLSAVTIDGFAVRLAERYMGTGAPVGTFTVELVNNTTGVTVYSVTVNIADLAQTYTTDHDAGWYFFNPGFTHTPNGTDAYLIRMRVSATTYGVWMAPNVSTFDVSTNWAHFVRENANQAPAAGDVLHIMGQLTGPGAWTTHTVTMDLTTVMDFGIDNVQEERPALAISDHGVLAYGFAASTNYILRLSGYLKIFSGGTLTIGTVANPIPRSSTAVLEFDCGTPAPANEWGVIAHQRSTVIMQGQSRTAGKNEVWALLTANVAATALFAAIDRDTGWLANDEIAIASTSTTPSQSEDRALLVDATFVGDGHDLRFAGLTNAHLGSVSDFMQAEVILLTRNVKVRSTSPTAYMHLYFGHAATVDIDWVEFRYIGSSNNSGMLVQTGTVTRYSVTGSGNLALSYCSWRDLGTRAIYVSTTSSGIPATAPVVIEHGVAYRVGNFSQVDGAFMSTDLGGPSHVYNDLVGVYQVNTLGSSTNSMFRLGRLEGPQYTNLRSAGATGTSAIRCDGLTNTPIDCAGKQLGPWTAHGGINSAGIQIMNVFNAVFEPLLAWNNFGQGLYFEGVVKNVRFKQVRLYGNFSGGVNLVSSGNFSGLTNVVFEELSSAGTTSQPQSTAIYRDNSSITREFEFRVEKGDFGIVVGLHVKHTSAHLSFVNNQSMLRTTFVNCLFDATTPLFLDGFYGMSRSRHQFQRYNRDVNNHFTQTPEGKIAIATEATDPGVLPDPPGVKLTPSSTLLKLDTAAGIRGRGFLVAANDGQAATVRVWVRKTSAYNGALPRMIFKASSGLALDTDTVAAVMSGATAANVWEVLLYTTPPAIGTGVFEFVVDCDGTAGSVFVDTWNAE